MNLSRNITSKINWLLDNFIPPVLRDNKVFMFILFYILFGKKYIYFMNFKQNIKHNSPEQIVFYYNILKDVHIKRETDLNKLSIAKILDSLVGLSVLDIACGTGFLANKIVKERRMDVTAIDFILNKDLLLNSNPKFLVGSIEEIPFPDKYFDTVVCTHTLEHVYSLNAAIRELRRVTRKRLIIVVPKQREYKYTFDLHLHFFPELTTFLRVMDNPKAYSVILQNDIFYYEDNE